MGLEFLARVRTSSIGFAVVAGLCVASYAAPLLGLALAAGALVSLVNLSLLERLIVALTGPGRGSVAAARSAGVSLAGMLALAGAGAFLLRTLDAAYLLAGFLVPFAVLTLKAASLLVIGSRSWKRMVASPWRAAIAVALVAAGAWLAVASWSSSVRATTPQAAETPAAHGAQDPASGAHGTPPASGAHGAEGAAAHGEGHAAPAGPQKFANVITILTRAFPDAGWSHFLHTFEAVIFALLIAAILALIAFLATRNAKMIPGPLQNVVEMLVESLHDFVVGILGPKYGPRYVPFLGTLFVYILAMNLFGLIPFMDSPTSSLNITVALALTVFVYAQYIGFKELGVVGYLDHLAGNPRTPLSWGLVPLMLPIHLLGEVAKPISLSCRLFGNVFGEDMLLVAFATLGVSMLGFLNVPFGLPMQLPFLFLALLTSTLQALVFTVLSTIYFLLMLPHEHEEHGTAEAHAAAPAHH